MCNASDKLLDQLNADELILELRNGKFEKAPMGRELLTVKESRGFLSVMEILDNEVNGPDHEAFSPGDIGRALERELRILLCSDDAKYEKLRTELDNAKESVRSIGVAIATAIATTWNISAGLLTPFVLVFLLGIIELSVQAWCSGDSLESL